MPPRRLSGTEQSRGAAEAVRRQHGGRIEKETLGGGRSTLCTARHPALCTALDVLRSAYRAAAYDRRFTRVEPNCTPTGLLPLTAVVPLHYANMCTPAPRY